MGSQAVNNQTRHSVFVTIADDTNFPPDPTPGQTLIQQGVALTDMKILGLVFACVCIFCTIMIVLHYARRIRGAEKAAVYARMQQFEETQLDERAMSPGLIR